MGVVLILLVIFGYISADRMAKRQSEDIEAIVRKLMMLKIDILVVTNR